MSRLVGSAAARAAAAKRGLQIVEAETAAEQAVAVEQAPPALDDRGARFRRHLANLDSRLRFPNTFREPPVPLKVGIGRDLADAMIDAGSGYGPADLRAFLRWWCARDEERARFLIDYAERHGPLTVRSLYYQAEVAGVAGIEKDEPGYAKVQRQVLALRRKGRLAYGHISDATRWIRKPRTFGGPEEALADCARLYRKSLWAETNIYLEVWCEKDAVTGTVYPVTDRFDVPLMVCRGYSSETFCYEAVAAREGDPRPYWVLYLGDFDRAGQDAARSLEEKLRRFATEIGIEVYFEALAVTVGQIIELRLPTREPKRVTAADRKWRYPIACELDAIPPDYLRDLVQAAIEQFLPPAQFEVVKTAEASERTLLRAWADQLAGAP